MLGTLLGPEGTSVACLFGCQIRAAVLLPRGFGVWSAVRLRELVVV